MQSWDFNCPQFVDFEAGLQDDSPTDLWFENLNRDVKREPELNRNMFGPRMATPKLKHIQISKNSPYVNTNRPVKTDDEKLEDLCHFPLRKSISLCSIEQVETPKGKYFLKQTNRRQRIFSENCKNKKKMYPTTPKCLKRTLHYAQSKKAKTTEEKELETISELQNKLIQHLRLNEVNLKRMKMNKPPVPIKNFNNCRKLPKVRETKDLNIPDQQLDGLKDLCRKANLEEISIEKVIARKQTLKMKFDRLNAVLHSTNKKSEIPSNVLRDLNLNNDNRKVSSKKISSALYQAHSGLKFLPNQSKTVPHPFSFDSSYASSQSMNNGLKDTSKVFPSSVKKPLAVFNKENY